MSSASIIVHYIDLFGTILFYSWPFIILIWLFAVKRMWSRYPIEAVILELRGKNIIKTNDRVGKFDTLKDGGIVKYRLQKAKDTIPVFDFDWIIHNNYVANTLLEKFVAMIRGNIGTVFLFRYGSKQYKPIKPNELGEIDFSSLEEIKDKKGNTVLVNSYIPFDPRKNMTAVEFDVIDWDNINFMVQEQRATMQRRQKSKELWISIAVPAMIIAGAVLVSLFIIKFSADAGADLRAGAGQSQQSDSGGGSKILGGIDSVIQPGA